MADEAENLQPDEQPQDSAASPDAASEPTAENAVDEASAIADDVAAQADEGADMSDEEAEALAAAMIAVGQVNQSADAAAAPSASAAPETGSSTSSGGSPFSSPEFAASLSAGQRSDLELLSDVHMNVRIELGRTHMFVEDVLRLGDGAVVELDKLAGDPVDVYVNDRKVARGEVLVLNDNFCVRISEILDLREN